MEKIIEIDGISFSYGRRRAEIFSGFSLAFGKGTICGLLGRNGSGKSTLLYLMCGLLRARSGSIRYKGIDVALRRPNTLSDMYIVPEEFTLPDVKLSQFVKLNAPFYPNFSNETLRRCLDDFGMPADIHLGELSMGQKKKAYMCFALATNTSLLLMDEPTNGFDIPSKSQMRKVIASGMTDERTIVISTHQVRDVENLLDHIVMIDDSRLLLDASYADITAGLLFEERPLSDTTDDAIYVQPSLHGNSVIAPNRTGEESAVNLEVLFNAVLADGGKIRAAIDASTEHNND